MTRKQPAASCTPATGKPAGAAAPADTDLRRKLTTTVVLVLFALVAIVMATLPGSPSPIAPRPACS